MKIVIMNDLLTYGGAEMQSKREKEILQSKGHDVFLMTFDYNFPSNDSEYNEINGFYNIPIKNEGRLKIKRKLFFDKKLYKKIKIILDKLNPDIIHINNFYLAPITQYNAVKGYKTVQTIRDYLAVCPLSTCIYKDYSICKGKKYNNCLKKCRNYEIAIKTYMYNKAYKLRQKNINKFICPSEKLTQYCKEHKYNIACINNPFDFTKLNNFKKNINNDIKQYMYYGLINEKKGIYKLLDAFSKFCQDKNAELIIAGKADDDNLSRLKPYLINKKIKYLGYLNYNQIIKQLQDIYSVIVPSLWLENYPNTVLESMCTETLVLGSNRGGIPDMIKEDKGIMFDILNEKNIIDVLNKSYNMSIEEYVKITKKAKSYTTYNNSIDKYYERLISCFNDVIDNKVLEKE